MTPYPVNPEGFRMPRTLLPPDGHEPPAGRFTANAYPTVDGQAVLDFVRGEYVPRPQPQALQQSSYPQLYVPAAATCFAIVQYDPAATVIVRRIIGMFGDVGRADRFAREDRRHLYDIVPATAVIATQHHDTP
jgi:hypothetical protein